VFTLVGRDVSWKLSKQTYIARSIMEVELVALEKAGSEAKWLRSLLIDLPLFTNSVPPVCIHCDCQAAIARAKSKWKSQHIQLRQLIDNEVILNGPYEVSDVKKDLINPLTKPLIMRLVCETSRGIGLIPKLRHYDGCSTSVIGDPMNEVKWVEVISDPYESIVILLWFSTIPLRGFVMSPSLWCKTVQVAGRLRMSIKLLMDL
jgi:hypothetical protein